MKFLPNVCQYLYRELCKVAGNVWKRVYKPDTSVWVIQTVPRWLTRCWQLHIFWKTYNQQNWSKCIADVYWKFFDVSLPLIQEILRFMFLIFSYIIHLTRHKNNPAERYNPHKEKYNIRPFVIAVMLQNTCIFRLQTLG